jgi:hypothetical protein
MQKIMSLPLTDLTHISSCITRLDIFNEKRELFLFRVNQVDPVVSCDDMVMNGQDSLVFYPEPSDLISVRLGGGNTSIQIQKLMTNIIHDEHKRRSESQAYVIQYV